MNSKKTSGSERTPRELSTEEVKEFMAIAAEAGKGSAETAAIVSLPEGIPIPDVFRYEGYYRNYGLEDWAKDQYRVLTPNARPARIAGPV